MHKLLTLDLIHELEELFQDLLEVRLQEFASFLILKKFRDRESCMEANWQFGIQAETLEAALDNFLHVRIIVEFHVLHELSVDPESAHAQEGLSVLKLVQHMLHQNWFNHNSELFVGINVFEKRTDCVQNGFLDSPSIS